MGGQRPGKALVKTLLLEWPFRKVGFHESRPVIEEMFLWGYQTAQRAAGVPSDSAKFVVSAEMILTNERKKIGRMLGWFLTKKNGSRETLAFKDVEYQQGVRPSDWVSLFPVVKRRKRRKPTHKSQPQVTQGVAL